ncbi:Rad2 nuclease [Coemansia asiatica]|uniref:Rad2 nuclease n=1 Tax=Coemansia asiatica TaxID=1052880 RepID=A0A9W8CKT2_9FUNG|nr:Rad2 nuclease [Coemansia asiatica]
MNRARMLRHYNVRPYFVFDGGPLPSKRHTELARQQSRMEKRQLGIKLWNQGKKKQAFEQFTRSIEVTPEMAKAVIRELEKEGFDYVVAPYEADAQLAYLESRGVISAAISEDSDLIVFGCRNIIFKLDQYGEATIFDRSLLDKVKAVDICGWSNQRIRHMCILSGCDYIASVPGVGLKRAYRYVARSSSLDTAVELMRADRLQVPENYEEQVARADLTFMYQRVYDPANKRLDHVGPLGAGAPSIEEMSFLGDMREPEIAHGIAMGRIDPITLMPFGQEPPMQPSSSIKDAISTTIVVISDADSNSHGSSEPSPVSAKHEHGHGHVSLTASAKKQATRKTAVPVSRAKSLLSFWAKPKQKEKEKKKAEPVDTASSSLQTTSPITTKVPVKSTTTALELPEAVSEAGVEEVRVKFRAKDTTTSELVTTTQQSRFFRLASRQELTEQSANPEAPSVSAVTTPQQTKNHVSQSSQTSLIWPNTPAELVQSQEEIAFTPTQIETDSSSQSLQLSVSQEILATSTLVSQSNLSKEEPTSSSATRSQQTLVAGISYSSDYPVGSKPPVPRTTPISQLGRRLSGDRFVMDTPPSLVNSPDPVKRKLDVFVDSVKKYRFTTQQQQQQSHSVMSPTHGISALRKRLETKIDDIVDSSDSEKENAIFI